MRKRNHTSRRKSSPVQTRRCRRLLTESLEQRSLMAADLGLTDGYLQLHGTDQNDVAEIYQQGDSVIVEYSQFDASGQLLDSRQETYSRGDLRGIFFQGNAGDDVFVNDSDLPAIALGGAGNDVLIGGSADDVISGGCGDDRMSGGAGNDVLLGGSGDNVSFDASGIDAADPVSETDPAEPPVAEVDEPVSLVEETQSVEESLPVEDTQPVEELPSAEDSSSEHGCAEVEAASETVESPADGVADVAPPVEETVVDETPTVETAVDEPAVQDPLDCPLEESPPTPEDVSSEPVVILDQVAPEPFVGPIAVGVAIDVCELPAEASPADAPPTEEPAAEVPETAVEVLPVEATSSPATSEVNSQEPLTGGNDILVGGPGSDLLLGGEGDDGLFGDELPAELLAQLTLNHFSWFQGGQG